jgi:hypothetical protein
MLFKLTRMAGKLDTYNDSKLKDFSEELKSLRDEFRLHATLEEKFIHPYIRKTNPGIAWRKEEEHQIQHRDFDDLVNMSQAIISQPLNYEKKSEMGLELYRALNRFIAIYLTHINEEEETIQTGLWETCTQMELGKAMSDIINYQKPEELASHLDMMFAAMTPNEIVSLIGAASKMVQPEALQNVYKIGERVADPEDWLIIKNKLAKTSTT